MYDIVKETIEKLMHKDYNKRKLAAFSLSGSWHPEYLEPVIETIDQEKEDSEVRYFLIKALCTSNDERSLPVLLSLLSDMPLIETSCDLNQPLFYGLYDEVKEAIYSYADLFTKNQIYSYVDSDSIPFVELGVHLLGCAGTEKDLKKLSQLAEHESFVIRRETARAAGKILFRKGGEFERKYSAEAAVEKGKHPEEPAAPEIPDFFYSLLKDEHPDVRAEAVMALEHICNPDTLNLLFDLLVDEEAVSFRAEEAIETILRVYPSCLTADIIDKIYILAKKKILKGYTLISILYLIGDNRAVEMLRKTAGKKKKKNDKYRLHILGLLAKLGQDYVYEELIEYLHDSDHHTRVEAAQHLALLGDLRAVSEIISEFESLDHWEYWSGMRRALLGFGEAALPGIIDAVKQKRFDDDLYFSSIGAAALSLLAPLTSDKDEEIRERALCYMGDILKKNMNTDYLKVICDSLDDKSETVRERAVIILSSLHHPRAIPSVLSLFKSDNRWFRKKAIEALWGIIEPELIDPLCELLEDNEEEVRFEAALKLAEFDDERVRKPLQDYLAKEPPAPIWDDNFKHILS